MNRLERLSSREVYRNPRIVVREDRIRKPDGSDGIYSVIDKPPYGLVIAHDRNRVRLSSSSAIRSACAAESFRKARHRIWSTPSQPNSRPPNCARNRVARRFHGRAGATRRRTGHEQPPRVGVPRDGHHRGRGGRDHEEQDMRSAWFSRAEIEAMIRTGEITDAQSIAAFAQFLLAQPVNG